MLANTVSEMPSPVPSLPCQDIENTEFQGLRSRTPVDIAPVSRRHFRLASLSTCLHFVHGVPGRFFSNNLMSGVPLKTQQQRTNKLQTGGFNLICEGTGVSEKTIDATERKPRGIRRVVTWTLSGPASFEPF